MSEFCLVQHFRESMDVAYIDLSWRSTTLSVDCEKKIPNFENGDPWDEGERLVSLKAVHNALISVATEKLVYNFLIGVVVGQNETGENLTSKSLNDSTGFTANYLSDYPSTLKIISDAPVNMNPSWLSDTDNKDKLIDRSHYKLEEYKLKKSIVVSLNNMLISTSKNLHNRKVRLQNMIEAIHEKGVSVSLEKTMLLARKS